MRVRRPLATAVGAAAALGTAFLAVDERRRSVTRRALLGVARTGRLVAAATRSGLDYRRAMRERPGEESDWSDVHEAAAERFVDVCRRNRGVYVKLGQSIALMDHVLPAPFPRAFSSMFAAAPVSSFADVERTIRADLGAAPDELFENFSREPVASASLAQVHTAEWNGRRVAVKVQHLDLDWESRADVLVIDALLRLAAWLFPDFSYAWIGEETRKNLPLELDFVHEARNSERTARDFADWDAVYVPRIEWDRTSKRVLTMEFIEGIGAGERDALVAAGVDPAEVSRLISKVFAAMMFRSGFVHCDPHPGNMLVRQRDGRTQLVLLDHGLYQQLSEKTRLAYANLWKSIVFTDEDGVRDAAANLGAGELYRLFASMISLQRWDDLMANAGDGTIDHESLARDGQLYVREIIRVLNSVDRKVLFLLKTNDCLRHVDRLLGTPFNSYLITSKFAVANSDATETEIRSARLRLALGRAGAAVWRLVATPDEPEPIPDI